MEQFESATNTFRTSNSVFKTHQETWHTPSPPNVLHRQLPQIPKEKRVSPSPPPSLPFAINPHNHQSRRHPVCHSLKCYARNYRFRHYHSFDNAAALWTIVFSPTHLQEPELQSLHRCSMTISQPRRHWNSISIVDHPICTITIRSRPEPARSSPYL
ncbi:hypothetical protein TorRG33x02_030930 [Trema orientale]|uniref:Uncharacterized protein n=1 Tax=Trema orientale TaxID=63057 RepID=A0A2P5FU94_TREOI|nr:hypothetical protein TorRG33x02_030930 [Trema orientale]